MDIYCSTTQLITQSSQLNSTQLDHSIDSTQFDRSINSTQLNSITHSLQSIIPLNHFNQSLHFYIDHQLIQANVAPIVSPMLMICYYLPNDRSTVLGINCSTRIRSWQSPASCYDLTRGRNGHQSNAVSQLAE